MDFYVKSLQLSFSLWVSLFFFFSFIFFPLEDNTHLLLFKKKKKEASFYVPISTVDNDHVPRQIIIEDICEILEYYFII